jgi:conserved hypothetical protein TIGR00096
MGKLYVVPTPIGNLNDITIRAIDILSQVGWIICEDTRRTVILLNKFNIKNKKLVPYYSPVEKNKIDKILDILFKDDMALVVDSGMPAISDPGYRLIKSCWEKNLEVEVLPGPSSVLTALVASGINPDRFLFLGFLPKKGLLNFLSRFKDFDNITFIFFDNSSRIVKTLKLIYQIFGDCQVFIGKEMSKIYQEYLRERLKNILETLKNRKLKGEITVVFRKISDIEF